MATETGAVESADIFLHRALSDCDMPGITISEFDAIVEHIRQRDAAVRRAALDEFESMAHEIAHHARDSHDEYGRGWLGACDTMRNRLGILGATRDEARALLAQEKADG